MQCSSGSWRVGVPGSGARRLQPSVVRRCPDEEEHRIVLGQGHPSNELPSEPKELGSTELRALSRAFSVVCRVRDKCRSRRVANGSTTEPPNFVSSGILSSAYQPSPLIELPRKIYGKFAKRSRMQDIRRLRSRSMITRINRESIGEKRTPGRWDTFLSSGSWSRETVKDLRIIT